MTGTTRTTLGVILGLAIALSACGDDEENSKGSIPNSVALVATASDIAIVTSLGFQARTLAELSQPIPGAGLVLPDTLFPGVLTCPVSDQVQDSTGTYLSMDYGPVCDSDLDGLPTSGAALFSLNFGGPSGFDMSTELDTFAREGRLLQGTLDIEQNLGLIDVHPRFLSLSGKSLSGVLSASFVGISKGPTGPEYCRDWIIVDGGGSMTIGDFTYTVDVLDTLRISTCCPYPLEGEIMIGGGNLAPAFFDFGDGTCDNQARLTVGGESQTIALGYDF